MPDSGNQFKNLQEQFTPKIFTPAHKIAQNNLFRNIQEATTNYLLILKELYAENNMPVYFDAEKAHFTIMATVCPVELTLDENYCEKVKMELSMSSKGRKKKAEQQFPKVKEAPNEQINWDLNINKFVPPSSLITPKIEYKIQIDSNSENESKFENGKCPKVKAFDENGDPCYVKGPEDGPDLFRFQNLCEMKWWNWEFTSPKFEKNLLGIFYPDEVRLERLVKWMHNEINTTLVRPHPAKILAMAKEISRPEYNNENFCPNSIRKLLIHHPKMEEFVRSQLQAVCYSLVHASTGVGVENGRPNVEDTNYIVDEDKENEGQYEENQNENGNEQYGYNYDGDENYEAESNENIYEKIEE